MCAGALTKMPAGNLGGRRKGKRKMHPDQIPTENNLPLLEECELDERRNIMAEIGGWNNCVDNREALFLKAQRLCRECQEKYAPAESSEPAGTSVNTPKGES